MSIPVYTINNEKSGEVPLPKIFETPYRPDVIKKAVIHQQSNRFQPQGRDPMAGKRTTAVSQGVGHGAARDQELMRLLRELAQVTKERNFLRDAAAYFAKQDK